MNLGYVLSLAPTHPHTREVFCTETTFARLLHITHLSGTGAVLSTMYAQKQVNANGIPVNSSAEGIKLPKRRRALRDTE